MLGGSEDLMGAGGSVKSVNQAHSNKTRDFTVVGYNILAKSLGSNTIPWVMTVQPEFEKHFEASIGKLRENPHDIKTFKDLTNKVLKPAYLDSFHKNTESGNVFLMRSFWKQSVDGPSDIPLLLHGLKYEKKDTVSYLNEGNSEKLFAKTLRGVLKDYLPPSLARETFLEITRLEQQIYCWENRGPRVMELLTTPDKILSGRPSVIVLSEYDVHYEIADYNRDKRKGGDETFKKSMKDRGYDGIYFVKPGGGSGMAVWWDRDIFSWNLREDSISMKTEGYFPDPFNPTALNFDLHEHWHQLRHAKKSTQTLKPENAPSGMKDPQINTGLLGKRGDQVLPNRTEMPREIRRNVGMVRLTHRKKRKRVWVIAAHLMTSSRDKKGAVAYPGEVRAGELDVIKNVCAPHISESDAVIMAGDFNTQPSNLDVFSGKITPDDCFSCSDKLSFETGFDSKEMQFIWKSAVGEEIRLKEAFEDVHRFGDCKDVCTSRSSVRSKWIDYLWFSHKNLEALQRTDSKTPEMSMPNKKEPSDHRPIGASFRFK